MLYFGYMAKIFLGHVFFSVKAISKKIQPFVIWRHVICYKSADVSEEPISFVCPEIGSFNLKRRCLWHSWPLEYETSLKKHLLFSILALHKSINLTHLVTENFLWLSGHLVVDKLCVLETHFFLLIPNFRRFLDVVCFLLGNSPASEFYMPTFRNTLSLPFL